MRLSVRSLKRRLGPIAAAFHHCPASSMTGIAVTGTNGKTTVSWWIAHLAEAMGHPTASIGTVGCRFRGETIKTKLTTPDALTLHAMLADVRRRGAERFVLEASSAGLLEGRLEGLELKVAIFTNLTRDHLDLHGTMDAYAGAKALLFELPSLDVAVLNADDPVSERYARRCRERGIRIWGFSTKGRRLADAQEHVMAEDISEDARASRFALCWGDLRAVITLPHPGHYNIANILASTAALLALGADFSRLTSQISELPAPPGRMERLEAAGRPLVVIDYCHTPDAFEQILEALRREADARGGRLVMLFGCCGDRDQGKRPTMGAIAERLADDVWLTSDNPRHEDPAAIVRAIQSGMIAPERVEVELDRSRAIRRAVSEAGPNDVILLAGKGPETYQTLADGTHPHSDRDCAWSALHQS